MFAATSRYRNDGDAGLTLVGARYYDGQVGRFVSRDTLLTQKPYLYCNHDPVNGLDPSGHSIPLGIEIGLRLIAPIAGNIVDNWSGDGRPEPGWAVGVVGDAIIETTVEGADMGGVGDMGGAVGTIGAGMGGLADGLGTVIKYRNKVESYMDPDGDWIT